jgi:3-oxoadipate enol-lactonase
MLVDVGDGLELNVRADGPAGAPAVLFLNSIACDLSMWEPQMAELSARFRVVRFDARGHGGSRVAEEPFSFADLGRDALAVLDALAIEQADVIGVSLGGLVGLWLASDHPGRVRRLVLVATAARIGTPEGWRERAALVGRAGMDGVVDLQLRRFFSQAFRAAHPEVVARIADGIRAMSPRAYAATCLALADADLNDDVGHVRAPTLVVVGRDDVSTPPEVGRSLAARIRGARFVELEDAAHLCTLEQPGRFLREVLRFLDDE